MSTDTSTRILRAARELAEENVDVQGVTISLESVAQRVGLTKPGLMYHFPTKEALMIGLVGHAAARWAELLREHTGSGPEELSPFTRYRAYVSVATSAEVSRADYWTFSEALYHPTLTQAWHRHLGPWFDADTLPTSLRTLLTAARFCGDGAWMSEATGVFRAEDLPAVRDHALMLVDQAERQAEHQAEHQAGNHAEDQAGNPAGDQEVLT